MKWTGLNDAPSFEAWLECDLHARMDDVLQESIPDDLLRLVEALPEYHDTQRHGPQRHDGDAAHASTLTPHSRQGSMAYHV